ncbi:MAG: GNAT family N-acetyltransferase [Pseudomonadota bacterium]
MHSLLKTAFSYMRGRIDPPSSLNEMRPQDLEALAAQGLALIGTDAAGDIVACGFLRPHETPSEKGMLLGKLAVAPGLRRRGVARRLVDRAGEATKRMNRTALIVQTRIELTENHAAFASMGFEKIAETSHPGFDRPTSITMRKALVTEGSDGA